MQRSCWSFLMVVAGLVTSLVLAMGSQDFPTTGTATAWQDGKQQLETGPQENEKPKTLPMNQDSIGRRDYMRVKLMFTQNIIEGLTMKNFETIRQAGEEIRTVTEGAAWNAVDSDEYRFQSREFQRSVESLIKAAETGNIEATTLRFFGMTTKCVDCHEHLRMRADF